MVNAWLLNHNPNPVININNIVIENYRLVELPTNNLASDMQIPIQKHNTYEKKNTT
jgi:hypothetical protein